VSQRARVGVDGHRHHFVEDVVVGDAHEVDTGAVTPAPVDAGTVDQGHGAPDEERVAPRKGRRAVPLVDRGVRV